MTLPVPLLEPVLALAPGQASIDPWFFLTWMRLAFTSVFANTVVIGFLGLTVATCAGALMLPVNGKMAKGLLFNGLVGCGMLVFLSGVQFGRVPTTFKAAAGLGLFTFPETNYVVVAWDAAMSWIFQGVSWLVGIMIPLGAVLVFARVDWGWKMLVMATAMTAVLSLVGTGTLFTILANVVGVNVPILS